MKAIIDQMAVVVDHPYDWLADYKKRTGRRVIGCFPLYVPHEIVSAAGMVPVDIYGGSGEMTLAEAYLQSITCYPMRSATEQLLTGQLDVLDGVILATVCTAATSGGGMWHALGSIPYFHQLIVPRRAGGQDVLQYFRYHLSRLASSLGDLAGQPVSREALQSSIKLYNRSRSLLDQLSALSLQKPNALSPRDFATVRSAASFMPRAEYAELLAALLAELALAPDGASDDRVGLALVGNLCDLPQTDILAIVQEAGGAVVEDDSPLGRRMRCPVAEDMHPIDALARHYVDSAPCPTKPGRTVDANFEYLAGLVRSSHAQGVVFLRPLYCDAAGLDYPLLSARLEKAGIATLSLDLNDREPDSGQLRTRLEAFVEMLRR